jgi:uroporphyrinogen-III synthase
VRLLLTRPHSDAQRTAAALRAKHHEVVVAPLLHVKAITEAPIGPGPWAAVLVTSANAAHAIAVHAHVVQLRNLPAFAVGTRSAQALSAAGFAAVTAAAGGVNDLARLVAERMQPGAPLLYLAGEDRSGDLAGELRRRGFAVQTAIVYRAVAATVLPPAASDALAAKTIDGVLHFSRRSAQAYVNAVRGVDALASALEPIHFCISAQVAEPLARAGATIIRVAQQPAEAALIELIDQA